MKNPITLLSEIGEMLHLRGGHHPPVSAELEVVRCGGIANAHACGGIFLSEQPMPSDFERSKWEHGIRTVINMRYPEEAPEFDERHIVKSLGLRYYTIPWNGPDELMDNVFDRYRKMIELVKKPVLIHCSSADRVGVIWLAYRTLDCGLDYEAALSEAFAVGLSSRAYEAKARDYVRRRMSPDRENTPPQRFED